MPDLPPIFFTFFSIYISKLFPKDLLLMNHLMRKNIEHENKDFCINIASTREVKFLFVNKVILLYVK